LKVDPTDGRLENYLTEPGGGIIDGRNIRYLTQDDILGTVSVVKTINELKGGTVDQVVGNVTVDATDLDIRDLTSVSDSVAIVQGGALKTGATLSADNIGLLKTADQPLDASGASIPVLQPLNITPDPRDRNWTVTETVDIAQASGVTVGATLTTDNIGLFKPGNDVGAVATLKSGTIDVARSYGVDAGGTVHQVRVDPVDGRLQNYLVEPGGGVIDGRNVRYLTQNDVLGTIGVTKTVQTVDELRSGTIDQVKLLQSGNVSSTIAADDVGLLKTADQPLDVSSASVPVIQPLDIAQASGLTVGATLAVDGIGLFKAGQDVGAVATLKSGTIDVARSYGVDAGGTVHQVRVDPVDGRLQNYLVEPGGGVIDGRNVRYLTQNDVLGTIGVTKTVQTPRSASYNTLGSAFPCDGADQVPGTADVRTLDGFSLGIDVDGTVEVSHQIQTVPGGSWRNDGVGTLVTNEERISTINHKGVQYRPSLTNMDASSTVSVNIEWMGN